MTGHELARLAAEKEAARLEYESAKRENAAAEEEYNKAHDTRMIKIAAARAAWNKSRDEFIKANAVNKSADKENSGGVLRILSDSYFSHIGFFADVEIVRGNTVLQNFGKGFYNERIAERIDAVFNQYPQLPKAIRRHRENYDIYRHPVCLLYYVFLAEAAYWKCPEALPFSADFTKADLAFSDLGVSYSGAMGDDR